MTLPVMIADELAQEIRHRSLSAVLRRPRNASSGRLRAIRRARRIERQRVVDRGQAPPAIPQIRRRQGDFHDFGDCGEADPVAEERLHRDLVRRVQHGRRAAALPQRCNRKAERRESAPISGRSKVSWPTAARSSVADRLARRAPANAGSSRSAGACRPAPSSACMEPSRKVISACTTDCGCTSTSSAFRRDAEQVMRLDQFQALVHERRRIDGDLGAHRPGGMRRAPAAGVASRDALGRPGAERPAGGGERIGADRRQGRGRRSAGRARCAPNRPAGCARRARARAP